MYVVIIGPQGSGKGTQADRLAPKFSLMKISTGDLFRAERSAGTPLGEQVGAILDRGDLVPDELTLSIVEQRLQAIDAGAAQGAVFDGFPRTNRQARGLDETLERRGKRIDVVVELVIDEPVLVQRLGGRRVCTSCGRTYHIDFEPPAVEGVCDVCGGRLEQRADDSEDAIRRRLSLYRENTAPLLDHYRARGLVRQVDADQPVDQVERNIEETVSAAVGVRK